MMLNQVVPLTKARAVAVLILAFAGGFLTHRDAAANKEPTMRPPPKKWAGMLWYANVGGPKHAGRNFQLFRNGGSLPMVGTSWTCKYSAVDVVTSEEPDAVRTRELVELECSYQGAKVLTSASCYRVKGEFGIVGLTLEDANGRVGVSLHCAYH